MGTSNYKLVRLTHIAYAGAEKALSESFPDLDAASYRDLYGAYGQLSLTYSDTMPNEMRALGNEVEDFVVDCELLQTRWARENGFKIEGEWPHGGRVDVAVAQILQARPDVLYLQGASAPVYAQILAEDLKGQIPNLRLVVGYVGVPMAKGGADHIDRLISCAPCIRSQLLQQGLPSDVIYHGFDHAVLDKLPARRVARGESTDVARVHGLAFLGQTGFSGFSSHVDRYWNLVRLMLSTDLEIWGKEGQEGELERHHDPVSDVLVDLVPLLGSLAGQVPAAAVVHMLQDVMRRRFGSITPKMPIGNLFPGRVHTPVFGLDMYELLAASRIIFNRHISEVTDCAANMRMFETTGMGGCLVTESASNLRDLFEADIEVVTYTSIEEAEEKIRYLLDHPAECEAIADAGRRRTLRDHTLKNRAAQIHDVISKALG